MVTKRDDDNRRQGEYRAICLGKVGRQSFAKIMGGRKSPQQATAIIDPSTGKMAVSKQEIKKVTLKYCKDTLKDNDVEDEFKEVIQREKKKVKEVEPLKSDKRRSTM